MDQGYPTFATPWWLFIGIVAGYVVLSLFLGAKKTYFEPFVEPPEEPETKPASQPTTQA
jgi:hypothetical protein